MTERILCPNGGFQFLKVSLSSWHKKVGEGPFGDSERRITVLLPALPVPVPEKAATRAFL